MHKFNHVLLLWMCSLPKKKKMQTHALVHQCMCSTYQGGTVPKHGDSQSLCCACKSTKKWKTCTYSWVIVVACLLPSGGVLKNAWKVLWVQLLIYRVYIYGVLTLFENTISSCADITSLIIAIPFLFPYSTICKDRIFVWWTSEVRSGWGPTKRMCLWQSIQEILWHVRVLLFVGFGANANVCSKDPWRWSTISLTKQNFSFWYTQHSGIPLTNCSFWAC